ncbi:MAG: porin [Alphaproteobacteria bacterium]|nr:porin [Alphaproteobacteria bacterium]MBL6952113.1 porin [Alphaproteobacteria bacterium]
MKNRFLGTTAMVAGAMLLAAGTAQGAEKIHLGLGGYFKAFVVGANQNDGPAISARNHGIAQESEIHFKGETKLDNGITFGVSVELEGETSTDQIDRTYIYAVGAFGKVMFGQHKTAPDQMAYGSPWAISGVGLASPDLVFATLGNAVGSPAVISNISGEAEKLTYFTPRMRGVQLGLSYSPDNCEAPATACTSAGTGLQSKLDTGQQSEAIEIGANYMRQINGLDLALYAGMATGNVEGTAAGAEDQDQWGLGLSLGYKGLTLGADYRKDDLGTSAASTDRTDYSVGLSYAIGELTAGVAYAHGEVEAGAGLGQDETDGYQVGATYGLGPGVVLTGGITYWDVQDNLNAAAIENAATVFVIGTVLSF